MGPYWTTSVTTVVRVALPDTAFTVTGYVPAGVPVVVVVVVDEPQPAWKITSAKNPPMSTANSNRLRRERLPPIPTPNSASPETGNKAA
jgi:hypothetical protein